MKPPRYHGDWEEFLRAYAIYAREQSGLHAGRDFDRCVEDLLRQEAAIDLRLRDLHREVEELENQRNMR